VTPTIGVDVGRQQSWSLNVSPYVSRQFGASTSGTLGYSYTHTDVDGGSSGSEHQVSLGGAYAFTAVDQGSLRYIFRAFLEEESDTETSHSLLVGWGRRLGPLTNFFIELGPHFEDSDVSLEANVQLTHGFERGSAGLSYSRSQELVVGQAGAPIVDTVTASIGYQALRDLSVGVSAGFSNIAASNGEPDTQEYAFTAVASYALTTWAVASLSYQFTLEDDASDQIYRHVVTLALTFAYPMRLR
jgi:hypothetical protein